jgi:F-type H+-transporting ATPase subunit b
MSIFQTFGINLYLLVAEIVNFLIVLYLLKRFLYKPVFNMLQKRKDAIIQGLIQAEESKKLLEKAKENEDEILKEANKKAQKIISDAKNEAFEIIQNSQAQAKKQASIELDEAKALIELERKTVEKKLFLKLSSVMQDFLEKSTNDLFDDKMQKNLVSIALKKFKSEYN